MIPKANVETEDGKNTVTRGLASMFAVLLVLFLLGGCGRKAPPHPPVKNDNLAVLEIVELQDFSV